jgi:hypothetical protein
MDSSKPTTPPVKDRRFFLKVQEQFAVASAELNPTNNQRLATLMTMLVLESKLQRIPAGTILSDLSDALMKGTN